MAFKFSKRSLYALASCHVLLKAIAVRALELSPVDFVVTEGHRGKVAQEAAFASGNSKAHFGESPHNSSPSLALDVVPWPVDWSDASKFKAIASAFKRAAKELGVTLRWGGDFKSFVDLPHFEMGKSIDSSIKPAGPPIDSSIKPEAKPAIDASIKKLSSRGDLLSLSPGELLARVVWGECRGVDAKEALAIAFVAVNRSERPGWWGKDIKSVCMAPKQFSCLNPGDPNLPKILAGDFSDGSWTNCKMAAECAIKKVVGDPSMGAVAYHAAYICKPKDFGSAKPLCTIGKHIFYGIDK